VFSIKMYLLQFPIQKQNEQNVHVNVEIILMNSNGDVLLQQSTFCVLPVLRFLLKH
jgi:hypothetical protein